MRLRFLAEPLDERRRHRRSRPSTSASGLPCSAVISGAEIVLVRHHQVEPFAQDLRALLGGLARASPASARVGRLDRLARFLGAHPRHGAQGLAGRRVGDRDRAAVQRVDPLAIDVALLAEQLRILELHRAPPSAW